MSDLWINWRFFYWHVQVGRCWPWVRGGFNPAHVNVGSKWFERY